MNQPPNLLIVDDTSENLSVLEVVVREIKVNLIKASSGAEALEKTRGIKLALAIIDVWMPAMNGYELAVKLNDERTGDKVPVIFLTANYSSEAEISKGYNSGAVDYIFKPFNSQILLSKINVFLDLYNQKHTITRNAALLKKTADELTSINIELKKNKEKYKSYIHNAPDGVFVTDETGKYIEVNEALARITGYSKGELLKMSLPDILLDKAQEDRLTSFNQLMKTGRLKEDLLIIHKNGTERWCTFQTVKLAETQFLVFTKDITDRKRTEEELKNSLEQLQLLANYTEKARENERKAISRELHDDLGQALTAVKIDLGIIKQNVSGNELVQKIEKVSALVGETIKTVQRLTSQLRPEIIDDLGLDAAIKWYTKEFAQRNGIEIYLDIDSGITFSPDNSLTLFRIMQESLTNIARHSGASHVDIKLEHDLNNVNFRISDNGIGITEDELNSKKSFGIIGIKERATSLAGTCEIYSINGKGTIINLIFPLNKKLHV